MADKHSLNYDVRELKLGASFTNNKASQYHTIKYDFKPASVDVNKMATVDVGTNHQVTVTVPHLDGAGVPQTVFKGSQRPYTKECVLIIDRVTGEITLEKLSSNIQVKKTRQETSQKARPLTPVITEFTNTTQRSTSRTRVATNKRTNNTSAGPPGGVPSAQARFPGAGGPGGPSGPGGPGAAAGPGVAPGGPNKQPQPQNMVRSPQRVKTSPPQAAPWSGGGNSTLASLPMIGLDDALGGPAPAPAPAPVAPTPAPAPAPVAPAPPPVAPQHNGYSRPERHYPERPVPPAQPAVDRGHHVNTHAPPVSLPTTQEDSSSSSSSDSGSDSDSASDSDDDTAAAATAAPRQPIPNGIVSNPALPSDVLNDDLCLSESGSDSD